jgi:hypothetical protein
MRPKRAHLTTMIKRALPKTAADDNPAESQQSVVRTTMTPELLKKLDAAKADLHARYGQALKILAK